MSASLVGSEMCIRDRFAVQGRTSVPWPSRWRARSLSSCSVGNLGLRTYSDISSRTGSGF
eukprot:14820013-Alexandrium_andersonii.AAC.1